MLLCDREVRYLFACPMMKQSYDDAGLWRQQQGRNPSDPSAVFISAHDLRLLLASALVF